MAGSGTSMVGSALTPAAGVHGAQIGGEGAVAPVAALAAFVADHEALAQKDAAEIGLAGHRQRRQHAPEIFVAGNSGEGDIARSDQGDQTVSRDFGGGLFGLAASAFLRRVDPLQSHRDLNRLHRPDEGLDLDRVAVADLQDARLHRAGDCPRIVVVIRARGAGRGGEQQREDTTADGSTGMRHDNGQRIGDGLRTIFL